ncbi:MAG: type III PLP-dependent enzyme [Actinomycetota bacterium]
MIHRFAGAEAVVSSLRPADPLLLLHPGAATAVARDTVAAFPGTVAYAVKVCDHPEVLRALAAGGVREWDVASIHEIEAVRAVAPDAELHYMNPVKSREHIAKAHGLGVKTFAFDCDAELLKISETTHGDRSILPVLRLAVPNDGARFPLDGKFGCAEDEAVRLVELLAAMGYRYGLTFHVGSQCEDVGAWAVATTMACRVAGRAGVMPDLIDIGGGFPAAYLGHEPVFADCIAGAKRALDRDLPGFRGTFQCEPGRVLAAPAASVLVRVELRKGDNLFLNDGYYGLLSELKWMTALHPVRRIRPGHTGTTPSAAFRFFGPTCDSIDAMDGPYPLPADIDEGDWIEVSLMGAYSTVLSTRFNGFPESRVVVIDAPDHARMAA